MANKGGSYGQDMPEGVKRHRTLVKEMAEAAKARRQKKGRGNGARYCYDERKGVWPSVQKPLEVLAGKQK